MSSLHEQDDKNQELLLFVDPYLKMNNINKYEQDKLEYQFNKLCMIKIENASLLSSHMGQDAYYEYLKSEVDKSRNLIAKDNGEILNYYHYAMSFDTFVIAANESVDDAIFINNMKYLQEMGEAKKAETDGAIFMHRFVVILNQKHLMGSAHNQLYLHNQSQSRFIISDGWDHLDKSTENELKVIKMINYAISNNKVIPYYQGIYSNKTQKIEKYESLMRIEDEEGKIHLPYEFLEISKKYRLYLDLTRLMITRVLEEFKDIEYAVSINISSIDLGSQDMKNILKEKIHESEHPERIVFEILEDECFKDINILKEFIEKVRTFGVKVGIDDFGSGYSNLLELIKIKPDFIKIDGEIIKSMIVSSESKLIIKAILMIAKELDVDLIAEFVENKELQDEIVTWGMEFSQGYYFSKPKPINELEL